MLKGTIAEPGLDRQPAMLAPASVCGFPGPGAPGVAAKQVIKLLGGETVNPSAER
ncbi:hypothetical protein M2302_005942 [Micromonospora sp. A200]|nr:hypothetical protein [Micromonospora sp. A200]